MANYTYNKDNLKYLHYQIPKTKKDIKKEKKFKKQLDKKINKEK